MSNEANNATEANNGAEANVGTETNAGAEVNAGTETNETNAGAEVNAGTGANNGNVYYQAPPPPQGYGQPPYPPQKPYNPGETMGILALIFGIGGIMLIPILLSIPGLICGIVGKNRSQEAGAPYGLAKAGIITSVVGLCLWVLIIVLCVVFFNYVFHETGTSFEELYSAADSWE